MLTAESAGRALGVHPDRFRRHARKLITDAIEHRPGNFLYTPEQVRRVGQALDERAPVKLGFERRRETFAAKRADRSTGTQGRTTTK